ncbi:MAG: SPFH/Band 7/PHB domain protein [Candidatus Altiarchaeota archaeon]|nr:SPFH/Band 7/PHB domain protein [Candidatus Altiarchaeota archaeon]
MALFELFSVLLLFVLGFLLLIALSGFRIIRPYEKGIIERFGKYQRTCDQGLKYIIPLMETMRKVDVRERAVDVQPQEIISKDNIVMSVDAIIYYSVLDVLKAAYKVQDYNYAVLKLAQTILRSELGTMELDNILSSREQINSDLQKSLDEATDKWGIDVSKVELQHVDPPRDVTESMHKQMKAEREKRAAILEAEGYKQAAILRADGDRQSAVLKAQGQKEAQIEYATGQAQAIKLVSEANQKYFQGSAITDKQLEVVKDAFKDNVKFVVSSDVLKAAEQLLK